MKTQIPPKPVRTGGDMGPRDRWVNLLRRHFRLTTDDLRRKRGQRRFDVEGTIAEVLLENMERPDTAPPLTMSVIDVSPGGVMLRSFDPLPAGLGLAMRFTLGSDDITLMGRVMHCTETLGGYKVGVKLLF